MTVPQFGGPAVQLRPVDGADGGCASAAFAPDRVSVAEDTLAAPAQFTGSRLLCIGLGTTTVEPALTGGRLDGIGVYSRALLDALPGAGCEVRGFSYPPIAGLAARAVLTVGRAMPHSFAALSLRDLVTPQQSRLRMPVELYHATDYRIVRMDCPVVATLHDAVTMQFPQWCNPRLRGLKNWAQRNAAQKADHVIALSHFAVAELVRYFGVDERRITVVPCGVTAAWQQQPAADAVAATLQHFGLTPGYFLFVGTLQPRKNIDRILDAYLSLPKEIRRQHQCVIVGRTGWRCAETIARIQRAVAAGEAVVWLDTVDTQAQLRHVYAGAHAFVFPSLHEGFGIPVAEAFAAGVAVVTASTTSLPEVSQGAALEVDPLDVGAIAAAMLALVRDDGLRRRCVDAGLARAALLTWEQTARGTAEVYRQVLGQVPGQLPGCP
ncbi:MAG: glycosyltransferase family 4 protein [Herminiimonas sp.]|nr:glycosyltransferase family 4 protein [Herminiimonas sp.]